MKTDSPPLLDFQLTRRELRLKKVELRRMQPEEKDLRQRTKEFALQIIRVFSELTKTTEAQVLGKQVLRSGISVGANCREAYRARSRAEFIAKCGDSLRELEEWSVAAGRDIDCETRAGSG